MQKNTIWYAAAGALVLLSAGALYVSWRANHHAPAPPAANTPAPPPPSTGIANPVPATSGLMGAPLPPLEQSDKPLHDSLSELLSAKSVAELLRPEMLVRHIVVTVDNLPRKHSAVEMRPTKNVPGIFAVQGDEQSATIDPANYQRYAPYVHLLQSMNTEQFTATYFHYYPLFQQAYEGPGLSERLFQRPTGRCHRRCAGGARRARPGGAGAAQRHVSIRRSQDRSALLGPAPHGSPRAGQ